MKIYNGIQVLLAFVLLTPMVQAAQECNQSNFSNCLNGVGPAVTNPDSIRISSSQLSMQTNRQTSSQEESLSWFGDQQISGRSAGDAFGGWSLWGSYSRASYDADLPINSAVQPIASYDADQDSFLFGADRFLGDKLLYGLALGFESTDIDTDYNGGNNETDGFTVAPYIAYLINDIFSIDFMIGYSDLEYETDRIDNVSGGTITGKFDSTRWFTAANLNAVYTYNQWVFGGRLGFIYTDEEQDPYSENGPNTARTIGERNVDLKQLVAGLYTAYNIGSLEPFISAYYFNDLSRDDGENAGGLPSNIGSTQPDDDDEFQVGLGVRYFYRDTVSGSLEYNKVLSRDKFDADVFLITLRLDL